MSDAAASPPVGRFARPLAIGLVLLSLGLVGPAIAPVLAQPLPPEAAALHASLRVPAEYRTRFTYLGSFAVTATEGPGAKEMHVVYASPGAVEGFRAGGQNRFADGAVLVKEVFATDAGIYTTGRVNTAGRLIGWFVMVKDAKGAVASDPLWGEGWGWSWFDAGDPVQTTTKDWRVACMTCHTPARGNDWLHLQGYSASADVWFVDALSAAVEPHWRSA